MSLIAAADRRNWIRTLMVYLTAALPGVMVVPDGDDMSPPPSTSAWVRVTVQDARAVMAGRRSGKRVADQRLLVTADVFTRGTQLDGSSVVDAVEGLASLAQSALTAADLPLKDYVADASGSTTIADVALRFVEPAQVRALPSLSAIQRRQVSATALLIHEV